MKKKRKKKGHSHAVLGENVAYGEEVKITTDEGLNDIKGQAQKYSNNKPESQAGFVAEADHCATFNSRSALDRSRNRALREKNGHHGDYKIKSGRKNILKGEIKYRKKAEQTENALRGYGNKQRVAPADQKEAIKEIARRKELKGKSSDNPIRQQVGKEHQEVLENVSDSISDGRRSSTPRTQKDIKKIAKNADRGNITDQDILPPLGETLKRSAFSGAKAGAVAGAGIGSAVSITKNTIDVYKGEKSVKSAMIDTAVETSCATADAAVKGSVGSMARTAGIHIAAKTGTPLLKSVLRSGGPAAAAIGAVEIVKDLCLYTTDRIDGEELGKRSKKTGLTTVSAWGGAETGAAIGTAICPGPGTIVGGILGGTIFGIGSSFLIS